MEILAALLGYGIFGILGLAAFVVLAIVASEFDSGLLAAATFIIGLLVVEYLTPVSIIGMMMGNPLIFIAYVLGWAAIGVLYVYFWRFPEYIRDNSKTINRDYNNWAAQQVKDSKNNSFDAFLDSDQYREWRASSNKSRLGTWVGLWPFSMFWELSRKPFIVGWNWVYASCGKMFDQAGRRAARRAHERT